MARASCLVVLTAIRLVGCYSPTHEAACTTSCSATDQRCPSNLACGADLRCHATGAGDCSDAAIPPTCLADDFADGALDTSLWTLLDPANTPATVQEIGGDLQVSIPPAMNLIGNGVISFPLDASNATFTANVTPGDTSGYWEVIVMYAIGAASGPSLFGFVVGGQNNFSAIDRVNGVHNDVPIGDAYYHGEPYWRLRHESATNILHYEISADGRAWTQVHSSVLPFNLEGTRIQLSADTFQGGPSAAKVFEVHDVAFDIPGCQP